MLREVAVQKQVINWDEVVLGWQQVYTEAGESWREAFVPMMKGVIEDQAAAQAVALGMTFDVRNLYAEAWLDNYTMDFASQVMGETERELAGMLKQAQAEGWSIPTMQKHMDELFRQWRTGNLSPDQFSWLEQRMPSCRRELIARTETIRSSNKGINALYQNWGVQYKEWFTTEDERRCPWCGAMHGKIIPIGSTFWDKGDSMNVQVGDIVQSMTFKYEAVTVPPLHPNCRCCLLPWKPEWADVGVQAPTGWKPPEPRLGIGDVAKWALSMTPGEIAEWNKGTALAGEEFNHFTSEEAAAAIRAEGFQAGEGFYGRGIYLTTSEEYATHQTPLRVAVRAEKPVRGRREMDKLYDTFDPDFAMEPLELLDVAGRDAYILPRKDGSTWCMVPRGNQATVIK